MMDKIRLASSLAMTTLLTILALILIVAILSSCADLEEGSVPSSDLEVVYSLGTTLDGIIVVRFIDEEAGVVCYLFKGYKTGGLSCLPLSQTALE